jgi:hypothetical protein
MNRAAFFTASIGTSFLAYIGPDELELCFTALKRPRSGLSGISSKRGFE